MTGRRPALRLGARLAAVLCCLPLPARALDVAWRLAARQDLRPRSLLPGDAAATGTFDLQLDPLAEGTLGVERTTLLAQYAPSLTWREPHLAGGRFLGLHRGRLALGHRLERGAFALTGDGAYGLTDVGSTRLAEGSVEGAVPEVQTVGPVPYVRAATAAVLDGPMGERWQGTLLAGYAVSGSLELTATLPLQWGPHASARLRRALSRLDGLTLAVQGSAATFVTGRAQRIGQATLAWDRRVTRQALLTVGAGAAATFEVIPESPPGTQGPVAGTYREVLPVAAASLAWTEDLRGAPLGLTASLRLGPFADRFTANVYERLEGRVAAEWRLDRRWLFRASVNGAWAVPVGTSAQAGDRVAGGEAAAQWEPAPWLVLMASGRVLWTVQPRFSTDGYWQAMGTLSVMVREQGTAAW